ncbi:MAG: T9SS type A sorting domain-containing protein, partial [Phaeodactylibacter sp.]|nr:T9SS type A sorting domain-containing protein [Phaeodactylibacter sp.]
TLTVNDGNGNSATCTATVTVEDPSGFCSQVVCLDAEIDNLVNYIEGLGLASGLERAITRRLETAAIRFCRDYPASIVINGLNSVIDYVDYQSGGSIPTAEADYIITEVQSLIGAINAGIAECCSGEGRPIPGNSFTLEDDATGLEVAPNPFSNETVIRFFLPGTGPATLEVFNMQGQRVTVLCAETLDRGYHTLHWDGTAFNGEVLGSGIYLVRLRNGKMALTRKVSLVR